MSRNKMTMRIPKEELIQMYIYDNMSKSEIASKLGCKETMVKSMLQTYHIKKSDYGVIKTNKKEYFDREMLEDLYNRMSLRDISKKTNHSITYIRKKIEEFGIHKDKMLIKQQHKESCRLGNMMKYGVPFFTQTDEYKRRAKETNIKKYGCEYYFQSDDYKNKSEQTNLKKYGHKHPMQNKDVKKRAEQTCLKKYGATTPLMSKIYCGDKKNYSQTDFFNEQYKTRCLEKYGVDNYSKYQISSYVRDIIYNKEKFENYIKSNNIICASELANKLGIGHTLVLKLLHEYEMKEYLGSTGSSSLEKEVRDYINQNFETENNTRKYLDGKEIDIYIPSKNIGIEFNGDYWHCEYNKNKGYHQQKSQLAESKGIFIYHIFEYEWKTKKQQIINQLNNLLGLNQEKIYARKCVIKEVPNDLKKKFLETNHMQGSDMSVVKLGLYYNDELVSLMTFCKPRFNKRYQWELSRFCSKANCNVVGGASKLWNYFIKNYNPKSVISYSNISHTRGNLYSNLGFTLDSISEPNYVWTDGYNVLSRYQCQKHKLLEQGFEGKSEIDIMHNRGFYRVYDCGNKVWVWNNDIDNNNTL